MTMLIVLPSSIDALPSIEAKLTPVIVARWTAALKFREDIDVTLPRFHTTSEFELLPSLGGMGIVRLFDKARGARLPGIISRRPLYVSSFVHKARIDVDEAGTEASALSEVTGMTGTMSSVAPPPPLPFHVDHPFLYLIRSGDQILFLGRATDPRG